MFAMLVEGIEKLAAYEGTLDIVEVCKVAEQMEFLKIRALRDYERSDQWRGEGFLSAAAAVRAKTNMAHGTVAAALNLGAKLEQLPETAAAFSAGDISRQHADVVARACTAERIDAIVEVEEQLIRVAREVQPKDLGIVVRRLTDALDGDGGAAEDQVTYERRRLHASLTLDGMVITDGLSDRESGEILLTALEAEMERDFEKGDTRSRAQRRHDALINICRRALDAGELGTSHGVLPHISVVLRAEHGHDGDETHIRLEGEGAHVGPLSQATLERLVCDCEFSRILTRGKSEVIDVGRATRNPTSAQWKALVVRDQHCQAPGCDRPPAMCQAHHKWHWIRGGPTDLDNVVLLCWRHHRLQHQADVARAP